MVRPVIFLLLVLVAVFPAATQDLAGTDTFLRVSGINEAGPPQVMDDLVVFTYEQREYARYVAVAFAHENYEQKHLFLARRREGQPDLFFLAYQVDPELPYLEYRLIVDGVWLTDPHAPDVRTDRRGIAVGRVDLPEIPPYREESPVIHNDGTVTFRISFDVRISATLETVDRRQVSVSHLEEPRISLVGSFNGWDPFMHPLRPDPTREGFY